VAIERTRGRGRPPKNIEIEEEELQENKEQVQERDHFSVDLSLGISPSNAPANPPHTFSSAEINKASNLVNYFKPSTLNLSLFHII